MFFMLVCLDVVGMRFVSVRFFMLLLLRGDGALSVSMAMHTDDLSSDDDDENRNTVGRGEG